MSGINSYAFTLFMEFVSQDGHYIYSIHNIYLPLLARYFRQTAYHNTVKKFIAHFARKLGSVKIFLYVADKIVCALLLVFRFG